LISFAFYHFDVYIQVLTFHSDTYRKVSEAFETKVSYEFLTFKFDSK